MKNVFITAAIIVVTSAYLAEITINFSPFKISFNRPMLGIGFFLVAVGAVLFLTDTYMKGYNSAKQEYSKNSVETVKEDLENANEN